MPGTLIREKHGTDMMHNVYPLLMSETEEMWNSEEEIEKSMKGLPAYNCVL
jgi:hypothetical protein